MWCVALSLRQLEVAGQWSGGYVQRLRYPAVARPAPDRPRCGRPVIKQMPPIGVKLSTDIEYREGNPNPYRARVRWFAPPSRERLSRSQMLPNSDEAQAWVDRMERVTQRGVSPAVATMTLAEYGELEWGLAMRDLEPKTMGPYGAFHLRRGATPRMPPLASHTSAWMQARAPSRPDRIARSTMPDERFPQPLNAKTAERSQPIRQSPISTCRGPRTHPRGHGHRHSRAIRTECPTSTLRNQHQSSTGGVSRGADVRFWSAPNQHRSQHPHPQTMQTSDNFRARISGSS